MNPEVSMTKTFTHRVRLAHGSPPRIDEHGCYIVEVLDHHVRVRLRGGAVLRVQKQQVFPIDLVDQSNREKISELRSVFKKIHNEACCAAWDLYCAIPPGPERTAAHATYEAVRRAAGALK
jgi:hypothetical protein